MSSANELVVAFAGMQAQDDARLFAQESLFAATLPKDHPMQVLGSLEHASLLLACVHFRVAILLGQLEAGHRIEVASSYAMAYQREFLRALQKELIRYLGAAYIGFLPEDGQPKAQAALNVVETLLREDIAAQRWYRVTRTSGDHDLEPAASLCEADLLRKFPQLATLLARPDFCGCRWEEITATGRLIISIIPVN